MKWVKKISQIIFWVILVFIGLYSTFIIMQKIIWKNKTPEFMGYKNFIVLTGSMEPILHKGDIVIIKETKEIKENDIISFKEKNSVVTHRVIEVKNEDNKDYYITKGDANSGADTSLLSLEDIEGKYCFKIPFVGNIILFLQKPLGIIILFAMLVIFFVISSLKTKKER